MSETAAFADRLIAAVRSYDTPLCVGIDPFPEMIPTLFGDAKNDARAIARFGEAIIDIATQHTGVIKPQLGLFEPYGAEGVAIAAELTALAKAKKLTVILDAKRGDIGTTAEGYARASLGPKPGFNADCVTLNPYMGADTLKPFLDIAKAKQKGVAVLVRTSNPGAADLQDRDMNGAPLWARTAEMLAPLSDGLKGESGWSGLMIVAGATAPEQAEKLRALLPDTLFLIPGYGAQGAGATDARAGFVRGQNGWEGGVINSSRGVLYPKTAAAAQSLSAWREAISAAMADVAADLRRACAA
jgi:orotidine-5'-phosphate decarboxylase